MEPTIQLNPLQTAVQECRDKARNILRMVKINNLLQSKFFAPTELKGLESGLADHTKQLARVNYRISKLDELNPDYEDMKKDEETDKIYHETRVKTYTESVAKEKTRLEKENTRLDEEIAKWESGENKVRIEDVNQLAEEMIRKV